MHDIAHQTHPGDEFLAAAGKGVAAASAAAVSRRSCRRRSSARSRRAIASTSARSAPAGSRADMTCRASGGTTSARIVAVCDLDSRRVEDARRSSTATTRSRPAAYSGVTTYSDYRELLANHDIDAVVISTPDHWHALIAIDAVEAGKDVYLQKPASLTIAEGRALSDAVHRSRPHLPDRQPAAIHAAVPLRGGARAQRTDRPAEDRARSDSRRSGRRRRA